jgi:hypothetical protein
MSFGVEAALKKALPPSADRTGTSSGRVAATLVLRAGGGVLFVTTVVATAFAFYSSETEQAKRSEAAIRLDASRNRNDREQQPIAMPPVPQPSEPTFPAGLPADPSFELRDGEPIEFEDQFCPTVFERPSVFPGDLSASSASPRGEASRPPLIARPISVTYSRSASRYSRMRSSSESASQPSSLEPTEARLERLQALSRFPDAFATEAIWFAQRRASLSGELLFRIESVIAEFILQGDSPEAVRALPKVLFWYGQPNLDSLAKLLLRAVEHDSYASPMPRRQILIGTFQRYRTLDADWRDPAAGDVLRALSRSTTISSHLVPAIEALHPPYPAAVEDFLIEYSFAASCESMYAQKKALLNSPTCARLLDSAIVRLESTEASERESAYVILAAATPSPERADAILDALCHAFGNETVEPSPAAHAALARWIDREHADDFRTFCDCECPVRRYAARSAVARFPMEAGALAANE